MCSHGKVQAGDNVSETMPTAGIEHTTSRTAVEGANHSTILAIMFAQTLFTLGVVLFSTSQCKNRLGEHTEASHTIAPQPTQGQSLCN